MFLLRRKSDGKFYRNRDYHAVGHKPHADIEWTLDPSECRTFYTKNGAFRSRPVQTKTPFQSPKGEDWKDQKFMDTYHAASREWWGNKDMRTAYYEEQFEVVPVSIKPFERSEKNG